MRWSRAPSRICRVNVLWASERRARPYAILFRALLRVCAGGIAFYALALWTVSLHCTCKRSGDRQTRRRGNDSGTDGLIFLDLRNGVNVRWFVVTPALHVLKSSTIASPRHSARQAPMNCNSLNCFSAVLETSTHNCENERPSRAPTHQSFKASILDSGPNTQQPCGTPPIAPVSSLTTIAQSAESFETSETQTGERKPSMIFCSLGICRFKVGLPLRTCSAVESAYGDSL